MGPEFEKMFLVFVLTHCADLNDETLIGGEFKTDPNSYDFKSDFCKLIGLYKKDTFGYKHGQLYKCFDKKDLQDRLKELIENGFN